MSILAASRLDPGSLGDQEPDDGTPRKSRMWRHPGNRAIEVPYRTAMVIAVMETGISDYPTIAAAVGATVEEVQRIDTAEDGTVRQLCCERIPPGEYFRLNKYVRCPRCNGRIRIVPCIVCQGDRA